MVKQGRQENEKVVLMQNKTAEPNDFILVAFVIANNAVVVDLVIHLIATIILVYIKIIEVSRIILFARLHYDNLNHHERDFLAGSQILVTKVSIIEVLDVMDYLLSSSEIIKVNEISKVCIVSRIIGVVNYYKI